MKKRLLILGAGASKGFCKIFPTGLELIKDINYHFTTEKKYPSVSKEDGIYLSAMMNEISRVFSNYDDEFFQIIKNQLWNTQLHYESNYIRNNTEETKSIDNFIAECISKGTLDIQAKDIIKYSIYYLIKGTEDAYSKGEGWDSNDWIEILSTKYADVNAATINQNIDIITFNYDRTFEKYFTKYLKYTPVEETIFEKKIMHVYGSLGTLETIKYELANDNWHIFKSEYQKIKLIDEERSKPINLPNANSYEEVHFLGFGFDAKNMALLNIEQFTSAQCYATNYPKNPKISFILKKYGITETEEDIAHHINQLWSS